MASCQRAGVCTPRLTLQVLLKRHGQMWSNLPLVFCIVTLTALQFTVSRSFESSILIAAFCLRPFVEFCSSRSLQAFSRPIIHSRSVYILLIL